MKQIRSRFRLITMLLVCAFLLTTVLCAGSVLKTAGITLSSLFSADVPGLSVPPKPSVIPEPSVTPDTLPGSEAVSASPETAPSVSESPQTDNTPDPEYNVFGL